MVYAYRPLHLCLFVLFQLSCHRDRTSVFGQSDDLTAGRDGLKDRAQDKKEGTRCNSEQAFKDKGCPKGFRAIVTHQSCVTVVTGQDATWNQARKNCWTAASADLVRIDDKVINNALLRLIPALPPVPNATEPALWIGLRAQPHLRWLDLSIKVDYTNWAEGEPSSDGQCVSMSRDGWADRPCTDVLPYICEIRNGPPTLEVSLRPGVDAAFVGDELAASCNTFVEKIGTVSFKVETFLETLDLTGKVTEALDYVRMGSRCLPYSRSAMSLNLTADMDSLDISCCRSLHGGGEVCSEPYPTVEIEFPPQPPELTIAYHQPPATLIEEQIMTANCRAFVGSGHNTPDHQDGAGDGGDGGGSLTWVLSAPAFSIEWLVQFDGRVFVSAEWSDGEVDEREMFLLFNGSVHFEIFNGTRITRSVRNDDTGGPEITSTFEAEVSERLQRATLACIIVGPGMGIFNTQDKTAISTGFTVVKPPEEDTALKGSNNGTILAFFAVFLLIAGLVSMVPIFVAAPRKSFAALVEDSVQPANDDPDGSGDLTSRYQVANMAAPASMSELDLPSDAEGGQNYQVNLSARISVEDEMSEDMVQTDVYPARKSTTTERTSASSDGASTKRRSTLARIIDGVRTSLGGAPSGEAEEEKWHDPEPSTEM